MSIVIIKGNGFHGKFYFKDAKKAFEFYFEQCKDDRRAIIYHTDKPYQDKQDGEVE